MPEVFDHLNHWLGDVNIGRYTASQLEDRVSALLKIWSDWAIFSPSYLSGLEALFKRTEADMLSYNALVLPSIEPETLRRQAKLLGVPIYGTSEDDLFLTYRLIQYVNNFSAQKTKQSNIQLPSLSDADVDGVPMDDDDEYDDIDEIDGIPLDDDIDGIPMDEDIDGVPIDEDDIDGIPLNDDIDGIPMDD